MEKEKETIEAGSLGLKGTRGRLLRDIEDNGLQDRLKSLVAEEWIKIENSLQLDRRPRFE